MGVELAGYSLVDVLGFSYNPSTLEQVREVLAQLADGTGGELQEQRDA